MPRRSLLLLAETHHAQGPCTEGQSCAHSQDMAMSMSCIFMHLLRTHAAYTAPASMPSTEGLAGCRTLVSSKLPRSRTHAPGTRHHRQRFATRGYVYIATHYGHPHSKTHMVLHASHQPHYAYLADQGALYRLQASSAGVLSGPRACLTPRRRGSRCAAERRGVPGAGSRMAHAYYLGFRVSGAPDTSPPRRCSSCAT